MIRSVLLIAVLSAALGPAAAEDGDVTVRIVPSGTYAAKSITGPYSGLGKAYGEVGAWMAKHDLKKSGPAVSVFFDDPKQLPKEKLRSEARIPVDLGGKTAPPGEEGVRVIVTPPRLVIRTVHYGSIDTIRVAFDRLARSIPGRGIRYVKPAHHVYLTDLAKTSKDENRVEARMVVEPTGPVDVGIYSGPGAFGPFLIALSEAFDGGKLTFRPIVAAEIADGKLGKRCRTLLMPGGWAALYAKDLGKEGAKRVRDFVAKGGGYIGICAGAFFAAKTIEWEGERFDYPLDLFPGVPKGPVTRIAPWPKHALTKLAIDAKHPITKGLGEERTVLYFGGPVLEVGKGKRISVLARYAGTEDPAIVAFRRGKGRVFLTAVHAEVCLGRDREEIGWPVDAPEKADPDRDDDLLLRGVRWVFAK